MLARPLQSEHRLKNTQPLIQRSLRKNPQSLDETFPFYSPQLISHNMTVFTIRAASYTKRVWISASCERRNNEGSKVSIQHFRSLRGSQRDKEDVAS